jgi:Tol biopolymer transport system component
MKIAMRILAGLLASVLAATGTSPAVGLSASAQQTAGELFEKALYVEEGQGDLPKAIGLYQDIVKRFPENRGVAAKAQLHIGLCHEKLGTREAEKAFEKVIAEYPEQFEQVKEAREKLSALLKARSSPGPAPQEPNVRLIASGAEAQGISRVSPDGASLALLDGDPRSLCVRDLASGKKVVAATGSYSGKAVEGPVNSCWSPDGKKLAFGWFNADNSIELRTSGRDGSDVRTLYRQKNEMLFPMAWSPDGGSIAASLVKDFYSSYSVALVSAADGTLTILKTVKLLKTAPKAMAFSGDGRFVVADLPQTDNDPKHDLFAFPVDGGQEVRIATHPADDTVLGGRPGSDELLFSSDRAGTLDAWVVDFAHGRTTGEPRLVRKGLGQVTPLAVSREGSLYYSLDTEMVDIYVASVDLERRAMAGPPAALALPLVGVNYDPQWSPDGTSLAFVADRKGGPGGRTTQTLWLRDERTGESREIVTKLLRFGRPCWAPDGRFLYVVGADVKTSLGLHRVDAKTGETTFLVDSEPGTNIKFIAPARDGKSIYYTYFEFAKKQSRVMGIDVSTRETHELYRQEAPPDIGRLSVSPDGRALVFGTLVPGAPGLSMDNWPLAMKVIPLPGGTPHDLIKTNEKILGASCWTPDGKGILFLKDVSKGTVKKSELCFMPAEGGELQSLGLTLDGSPSVVSLHPDGRRLAFSVRKPSAEVWVMENFLPAEKK